MFSFCIFADGNFKIKLKTWCEITTNDVIKFSYHFVLSDARSDFSGLFHQDFLHIA